MNSGPLEKGPGLGEGGFPFLLCFGFYLFFTMYMCDIYNKCQCFWLKVKIKLTLKSLNRKTLCHLRTSQYSREAAKGRSPAPDAAHCCHGAPSRDSPGRRAGGTLAWPEAGHASLKGWDAATWVMSRCSWNRGLWASAGEGYIMDYVILDSSFTFWASNSSLTTPGLRDLCHVISIYLSIYRDLSAET